MTRRYGDSIDVRRRDDAPAEFVWRGRFYVVRGVLDHWIEVAPWWRSRPVQRWYESGGSPAPSRESGTDADPSGTILIEDGEHEVWRVEARAGRTASSGIFDLVHDRSTGAWTLARTMD